MWARRLDVWHAGNLFDHGHGELDGEAEKYRKQRYPMQHITIQFQAIILFQLTRYTRVTGGATTELKVASCNLITLKSMILVIDLTSIHRIHAHSLISTIAGPATMVLSLTTADLHPVRTT